MPSFIRCPECDLLQSEPSLSAVGLVRCARCGAPLHHRGPSGSARAVALTLTAAILFVIANAAPIATLELGGNRIAATIVGTASFLWGQHRALLATLVMTTAVLMPALEIGLLLYLLASARRAKAVPLRALRVLHRVRHWSMMDVLMLGTVVALARLAGLAHVEIGWGLWALLALVVIRAAIPSDGDLAFATAVSADLPEMSS